MAGRTLAMLREAESERAVPPPTSFVVFAIETSQSRAASGGAQLLPPNTVLFLFVSPRRGMHECFITMRVDLFSLNLSYAGDCFYTHF